MKGGKKIPNIARVNIEKSLKNANINYIKVIQSDYHDEVILPHDSQDQLKTQAVLQKSLGIDYIVALFLSPNTPKWLLALNALPMKYGLDLRGGMYLLDIDMQTVYDNRLNGDIGQIRPLLMNNHIRYSGIKIEKPNSIVINFRNSVSRDKTKDLLKSNHQFDSLVLKERLDHTKTKSPYQLIATLSPEAKKQSQTFATQQVVEVMRHRK